MRPLVRLWRVEHHEHRRGPFAWSEVDVQAWFYPQDYPTRMPEIWDDTVLRTGEPWVPRVHRWSTFGGRARFAFHSLRNLQEWVPESAARKADKAGHVVRLLAVPWEAHHRMRHQALYDSGRAVVLRTMSVLDAVRLSRVRVVQAQAA